MKGSTPEINTEDNPSPFRKSSRVSVAELCHLSIPSCPSLLPSVLVFHVSSLIVSAFLLIFSLFLNLSLGFFWPVFLHLCNLAALYAIWN